MTSEQLVTPAQRPMTVEQLIARLSAFPGRYEVCLGEGVDLIDVKAQGNDQVFVLLVSDDLDEDQDPDGMGDVNRADALKFYANRATDLARNLEHLTPPLAQQTSDLARKLHTEAHAARKDPL